jgi:hypothetical protein
MPERIARYPATEVTSLTGEHDANPVKELRVGANPPATGPYRHNSKLGVYGYFSGFRLLNLELVGCGTGCRSVQGGLMAAAAMDCSRWSQCWNTT